LFRGRHVALGIFHTLAIPITLFGLETTAAYPAQEVLLTVVIVIDGPIELTEVVAKNEDTVRRKQTKVIVGITRYRDLTHPGNFIVLIKA
jgi:hypothetical protein